jgi:hypothetical protein
MGTSKMKGSKPNPTKGCQAFGSDGAGGGNRTRTAFAGRGILSSPAHRKTSELQRESKPNFPERPNQISNQASAVFPCPKSVRGNVRGRTSGEESALRLR